MTFTLRAIYVQTGINQSHAFFLFNLAKLDSIFTFIFFLRLQSIIHRSFPLLPPQPRRTDPSLSHLNREHRLSVSHWSSSSSSLSSLSLLSPKANISSVHLTSLTTSLEKCMTRPIKSRSRESKSSQVTWERGQSSR